MLKVMYRSAVNNFFLDARQHCVLIIQSPERPSILCEDFFVSLKSFYWQNIRLTKGI